MFTNITPPVVIGALAVLVTAMLLVIVGCGFRMALIDRPLIWKVSAHLKLIELAWATFFAMVQGKRLILDAVSSLEGRLNQHRRTQRRRPLFYAHVYHVAREFMVNMLPMNDEAPLQHAKRVRW